MKIYHCDDPKDNPVPLWMVESKPSVQAQKETAEPIPQNLDSFFPTFTGLGKRKANLRTPSLSTALNRPI